MSILFFGAHYSEIVMKLWPLVSLRQQGLKTHPCMHVGMHGASLIGRASCFTFDVKTGGRSIGTEDLIWPLTDGALSHPPASHVNAERLPAVMSERPRKQRRWLLSDMKCCSIGKRMLVRMSVTEINRANFLGIQNVWCIDWYLVLHNDQRSSWSSSAFLSQWFSALSPPLLSNFPGTPFPYLKFN